MTNEKSEANDVSDYYVEDIDAVNAKTEQIQTEAAATRLNAIDVEGLSRKALTIRSRAALRLAVVILVQSFSVAVFAIDGSVIGGISALEPFRKHFNVSVSGSGLGLIVASMSIGNLAMSPFQWLSDLIGRRGTAFAGNVILVIGATLQAAVPNRACLIVGRVIGGMGSSLSATVGPLYMSEVSPACWRDLAVGLYCSCYSVGSILIACVLFGGSYIDSDWAWRLPMVFQIGPPFIVASLIYLCTPESPDIWLQKAS